MDALNFVVTVISLTASGALAPGPLFFVTISHGAKSGAKSGFLFSIAHTLVEFTLVMLLAFGLLTVVDEQGLHPAKIAIGVIGGIALLVFGAVQIHASITSKPEETVFGRMAKRNLLITGLIFTGLNPFFIVWWLTAGLNLILLSLEFASFAGVILMYICHVWMDYLWLTSVAHLAKIGTNVIRLKWYRVIMVIFGGVLIYFGLMFLIDSLSF